MSAFMLSKEHIDLLVNLVISGPRGVRPGMWHAPYFENETVNPSHANAIGEMLVKENLSSIHSRYPDTITNPDNTPGPFDQYWMSADLLFGFGLLFVFIDESNVQIEFKRCTIFAADLDCFFGLAFDAVRNFFRRACVSLDRRSRLADRYQLRISAVRRVSLEYLGENFFVGFA